MPITPAGQRDRRIAFLRPTVTEDELGPEVETFVSAVQARAKVLYGTGRERRDAASVGVVQSATFRVLSTARVREVTERWRIRDDRDVDWGIGSISPIGRTEIEFVATKVATPPVGPA